MKGIIAAVPTPVDEEGAPLRDPFLAHCQWLLDNGCDGLNILGSTGEANCFDTDARKKIMTWAAKGLDTSKLMVGTGTPSLAETIKLTRHADQAGYGTALVLPPYYYKPASIEGLHRWYAALHHALGAARIGIYFYNFPQMTGLNLPIPVIEQLQRDFPDRFTGIKDSSGDLTYCRDLAARLPEFRVFPSSETSLSEAAASGFAGCISATANQTAPLCAQLWQGRSTPDSGLLDRVEKLRAAISRQPLVPSVKYLVGRRTGDNRWANVLPPFVPLTDHQAAALNHIAMPVQALVN